MKITESQLRTFIKECTRRIISEAKSKQTLINQFYRMVHPISQRRFHDDAWQNVHHILDEIGDTPQVHYMLGRLKQNKLYNHQDGDEAYIGQYAADQRKKSNNDLGTLRNAHQQGFADQWDKNHKK